MQYNKYSQHKIQKDKTFILKHKPLKPKIHINTNKIWKKRNAIILHFKIFKQTFNGW